MPRSKRGTHSQAAGTAQNALGVVLVVEDEMSTRELLQLVLEAQGYRVETVPDGAAAVARIEAGGIGLVLLDVLLPGLYGMAVLRQVRAAPGGEHLPVLLLTALTGEGHRRSGLAAGATDYIVKPFDIDDLLQRVQRYLRPGRRPPISRPTDLDSANPAV